MDRSTQGQKTGNESEQSKTERLETLFPQLSRRRLLEMTTLGLAGAATAPPAAAASHTLTIEGTDVRTEYSFSVSGDFIENSGLTSEDSISGSTVTGAVGSGTDSYVFSGEITAFSMSSDANLFLDGKETSVTALLPQTLTIEGTDSRTEYSFVVDDDIAGRFGHTSEDTIDIQNGRVEGAVSAGRDSYAFSGNITGFNMSSDANLRLDGERVDVTTLLPQVLTIEGTGSRTNYTLDVSGDIAGRFGHSSEDTIDIQNGRVEGAVSAGRDSYAFSGNITGFNMSSDANLRLDGERVDVTTFLPQTLTVDGNGTRTNYSFTVDGGVAGRYGYSQEDIIDIQDGRVEGAVGGGTDSYAFSGGLADISVEGPAEVTLNGEPLDVGFAPEHTLSITSNGGRFSYEVTVGGSLQKSTANGATIDDNDDISGRTATGQGGGGGTDSYEFAGELTNLNVSGDATVTLDGKEIDGGRPPTLGIYSGLSDADFDTIDRIESWQNVSYPVQTLFVPWNPDAGHMNWLFNRTLPKIWNAGRTPLITWEPYTPGARAASADTQALVERGEYDAYLESLSSTTPDDIEVRIANGEHDGYIERWAGRLSEWLAGPDGVTGTADDRRAYIRFAHEMNGDWYPWSPTVGSSSASSYVDMWRHVHRRFESAGVNSDHVQWMWCVNADDVGSYTAEQLYPGDSYVDWLSVDGYQWGRSKSWSRWKSPRSIFGDMLGRVRGLADKPVCIGETASSSVSRSGHDPQKKDSWIRDAFEYFDRRGIDMWCWFNEDKETDWAMFDGVRGTETVRHNGERVNAYAAYRSAVETYAATAATDSGSMTTAMFTGKR